MDVRVVGVPVIDADPVELGAEVRLHLPHQLAGEGLEVGHLGRVLGRDDEAEVVAVVPGTIGECLGVGVLGLRSEQPGLLPIPGDPLAPEIGEVGGERRRTSGVPDDARLDDDIARPAGEQPIGLHGRALAAAEPGAVARTDRAGARNAAAGTLRGRQRLGDEGSRLLRSGRADAAWPDAEIVLAAHGRGSAHRAIARKSLAEYGMRRLRRSGAPRANAP
jgi:hypothetical protein